MPAPTGADWDRFAVRYDNNFSRCTIPHAADLVGAIIPQLRVARTVIDIGSGSGAFGLAYLRFFPNGIRGQTLIFTDISPEMLRLAQQRMETALPPGFETDMHFRVEDALTMGKTGSDSADVVVSCFGVFLMDRKEQVLATIRRVLRRGGVFATTAWTAVPEPERLKEIGFGDSAMGAVAPVLSMLTPTPEGTPPPAWQSWNSPDTIREMLDAGGFCDVRVHRAIHTMTFENIQQVWELATDTSPMGYDGGADTETIEKAKKGLWDKLEALEAAGCIFMTLASNIAVSTRA